MEIIEGALFGLGWMLCERLICAVEKRVKVMLSWGVKSEPADILLARRGHYKG